MSFRTRWGCLAVIAYPIVEIALVIVMASIVGWWWVLVYLVACLTLGLGLVRYALSATGRSLTMALGALGQPGEPTVKAVEGVTRATPPPAHTLLIVPAGLLIALPGLMTTVVGVVLWIPAVRRHIAGRVQARIETTINRPEFPSG